MDFALMTEPQVGMTYEDLAGAARWAEDAGLSVFARSDHYLWRRGTPHATDAFASLAGLARDTARIRLCVLVSPVSFRHPGVVLKNAVTIDEMSGGRFNLGVGTGWMQEEHDAFGMELWEMGERFDRLEECLGYLRAALSNGASGFAGNYYRLEPIDPLPKATGPLPIVIGGSGAVRTPHLAGTYANEYNLFTTRPEEIRPRVAAARAAAAAAGRDPGELLVSVMSPVLTGRTKASYRENLARSAATRSRTSGEHESQWREAGVPVGMPGVVERRLAEMAAAGVQRFYYQHLDPPDHGLFQEVFDILRG